MADVNTSIYAQNSGTQPLNALTTASQAQQLQLQGNQNKLFQQQFGANQAVSNIMKMPGALDPVTGRPNWNFIAPQLASSGVGYNIPQMMLQAQQAEQGQLGIDKTRLEVLAKRNEIMAPLYATVLKSDDPVKAYRQGVIAAAQNGVFGEPGSAESLNGMIAAANQMPMDKDGKPDVAALKALAAQRYSTILDAQRATDLIFGKFDRVDTGGTIQPVRTDAVTGVTTPVGEPIKKTLTPGEAQPYQALTVQQQIDNIFKGAQTVEVKQPDGSTKTYTAAQIVQMLTPGGMAGGAAPGVAPRAPGENRPDNAPAPAAGAPGAGPKPIGQSPSAGAEAYMRGLGTKVEGEEGDLNARVKAGADLLTRISEARDLLTKFQAGGGSDIRKKLGETAQMFGAGTDLVDKIAGGNLAASQEFQKIAVQMASDALKQSLGQSRIAQLEFTAFQNSNPNLDTDPRAIEKIYNFMTRQVDRDRQEQKFYAEQRKKPGFDPLEFPALWAEEAVKRKLITPEIREGFAKGVATEPPKGGAAAPAAAAAAAPAATGGAPDVKALRAQAQDAITKGAPADDVKARFKRMTGQDF